MAFVASVKCPVDSTTICTPSDGQSISAGSLVAKILIVLPPTVMESASALHIGLERTERGIVLQQVRQRLGICEIVCRNKFDFGIVQSGADYISPDTAEAVDSHFNCHVGEVLLWSCLDSSQ